MKSFRHVGFSATQGWTLGTFFFAGTYTPKGAYTLKGTYETKGTFLTHAKTLVTETGYAPQRFT
jgi:hypothetical protein